MRVLSIPRAGSMSRLALDADALEVEELRGSAEVEPLHRRAHGEHRVTPQQWHEEGLFVAQLGGLDEQLRLALLVPLRRGLLDELREPFGFGAGVLLQDGVELPGLL